MTPHPPLPSSLRLCAALAVVLTVAACGPRRLAVVGPMVDAAQTARGLQRSTELAEPIQIRFRWELNEAGARIDGVGVARVEPPYRARLDLFLDNLESVVSAALVEDELRLPYGSREDILPPVDLMWATLGVFRPVVAAELSGGDRLEGEAERLRYAQADGSELHYEVASGGLSAVELLEGGRVVEWVRLERAADGRYPERATYRNLTAFRELKITRDSVERVEAFDPEIWDPRE